MSYVPPALRARGSAASMRRDVPRGARRDVPVRAAAVDTPASSGTPPPSGELEGWLPSIRQPYGPPTTGDAGFSSGHERKPAVPTPAQVAEFKDSFKKRQESRADALSNINKAAEIAAELAEKKSLERKASKETKVKEKAAKEASAPPVRFPNNSTLVFFRSVIENQVGELEPSRWSWWRSDNGGPQMFGLAFMAAREDSTEDQFIAVWKSAREAELQRNRTYRQETEYPGASESGQQEPAEVRGGLRHLGAQDQSAVPEAGLNTESALLSPEAQLEAETEEMRRWYRVWQRVRKEGIEQKKPALLMLCNLWDHGHQPLFVNNPPASLKPNQSAAASRVWGGYKNNRSNTDFIWRPVRGIQGADAAAVDATGIGFGSREDDVGLVRMVDDPLAEASAGEFWVKSFAHSLLPLAFQAPWSLARKRMERSLLEQLPQGTVPRGKLNEVRRKLDELEQETRGEPLIHLADEMFTRTWYFNNVQNDAVALGIEEGALNFNRPIPFVGQQVWFQHNKAGQNQSNNTKGPGTFLGWFRITSVKFVAPGSDELRSMQRLRFGRRNKNETSTGMEPYWARFGVAQIPKSRWSYPYDQPEEQAVEVDSTVPEAEGEPSPEEEAGDSQVDRGKTSRTKTRGPLYLKPLKKFKSLTECEDYEMFVAGLAPPPHMVKKRRGNQNDQRVGPEHSPALTPDKSERQQARVASEISAQE